MSYLEKSGCISKVPDQSLVQRGGSVNIKFLSSLETWDYKNPCHSMIVFHLTVLTVLLISSGLPLCSIENTYLIDFKYQKAFFFKTMCRAVLGSQ